MTKLSDALHGAADRAPVSDASVSVAAASRRVRVQRGARMGGNALAGAGAAALIAIGVINPTAASEEVATALPAPAEDGGSSLSSDAAAEMSRLADWGYCGSYPLQDWGYGDGAFSLTVDWAENQEVEGGSTASVPYSLTASTNASVEQDIRASHASAVVLWDGMVVAVAVPADGSELTVLELPEGASLELVTMAEFVSCFDGQPLPASKYDLLVSQSFAYYDETAIEPLPAPEPEPAPEPSIEVLPPNADPETSVDPGVPSIEPDPATDPLVTELPDAKDESGGADVTSLEIEPYVYDQFRTTGEPIPFIIAGDPVEDPFGQYIPEPWVPPVLPDDFLTPQLARDLFSTSAQNNVWGMEPGTSRWIMQSDDSEGRGWNDTDPALGQPVERSFYGCSWGDGEAGFPEVSADLGWLDVQAEFPSRLGVSYGWVIDNNPEVAISVTNASEFSIPGFYGQPSRNVYLIKDGVVVAEGWPTEINRYGDTADIQDAELAARQSEGSTATVEPAFAASPEGDQANWGELAPGESLAGSYLWREVNTCWSENGPAELRAGEYTLLIQQSVHLETYVGDVLYGAPEPGIAIDPEPDTISIAPERDSSYQWVELQMWASLGTVTVTTN